MILIRSVSYLSFPTNLSLFLLKRFWALAVDQPPFPPRLFVLVVRKRLVQRDALTRQITTCVQFYTKGHKHMEDLVTKHPHMITCCGL